LGARSKKSVAINSTRIETLSGELPGKPKNKFSHFERTLLTAFPLRFQAHLKILISDKNEDKTTEGGRT
jgi:hypothetical protein